MAAELSDRVICVDAKANPRHGRRTAPSGRRDEAGDVARNPAQHRDLLRLIEYPILALRARIFAVKLGPGLHGRPICAASSAQLLLRFEPQHFQVHVRHEHAKPQRHEGLVADEAQPGSVVLVVPPAFACASRLTLVHVEQHLPQFRVLEDDIFGLGKRELGRGAWAASRHAVMAYNVRRHGLPACCPACWGCIPTMKYASSP